MNTGGLACTFTQLCAKCKVSASWDNSEKIGLTKTAAEVNRRSVMAIRSLGQGQKSLEKFCAHMELPSPVQGPTFYMALKHIHDSAEKLGQESMKRAAAEEVKLSGGRKIEVSGDGTWQKRGHNSMNGVSTLVGIKTGKALDVEVLSKTCVACGQYEGPRDTEEYEDWYLAHAPECQQNHLGTAQKMESDGMVNIFKRSEEDRGCQYTTYVGDGDSATFKSIQDARPYENEEIKKKECIGHIQKRMGRHLQNLKSRMRGQKLADGKTLGGRGRLSDEMILKIQKFYGNAIRENSSSVQEMQTAVWAIYYHMKSTDENSNHIYCPKGAESWCKYQQAIAEGTLQDFKQKKPAMDPICMESCKPVFEELTKEDLLQKCLGAYSQNPNESLHNLIWSHASKENFVGRRVVEIATFFAVLCFNDGQEAKVKLYSDLQLKVWSFLYNWVVKQDRERVRRAEKKVEESSKEARRSRRMQRVAREERLAEEEGLYYAAGAF